MPPSYSEAKKHAAADQSQIKLLEAHFKNRLIDPSLASMCKNFPRDMLCIIALTDHDY